MVSGSRVPHGVEGHPSDGNRGTSGRADRLRRWRARLLVQVHRARHQRRHGDTGGRHHLPGDGVHHLPEPADPVEHVPRGRGARRVHPGRCRRDRSRGRPALDPDGPGGELPDRVGGGARHQRDRGLHARARPWPLAGGRHGRHRHRGAHRSRAGHRRPAGGDHGRRAARPEAGDRRRHRPLHPVHRLRGWRADRPRQPDRRVQLPGRDGRHGSSCSAWPSRSC